MLYPPPNRETEAMQDGSDAVSDWLLLNASFHTVSGATGVSLQHGGGLMGYSQHWGVAIVADGTPESAQCLERVFWNDPANRGATPSRPRQTPWHSRHS